MDREHSTIENKQKKNKQLKKAIVVIINGGEFPTLDSEKGATEGVGAPATPVTTSTNPTNPRVLRQKLRTHLMQTRSNTPGATPPITIEESAVRKSR